MRIMIDTNVLISIIFFPSVQMNELKTKLCKKHAIVLCSHIVEELNRVTRRKFAHKLKDLDEFLQNYLMSFFIPLLFLKGINFLQCVTYMITLFLQRQYWKILMYS
jgi:predicted nucleic acid-binding protein